MFILDDDILIRTDGSKAEGFGHFYRSIALYKAFEKVNKGKTFFWVNNNTFPKYFSNEKIQYIQVSGNEQKDLSSFQPNILISDLPPEQNRDSMSMTARNLGIFHVAIDDMFLSGVDCDLCLNPTIVSSHNNRNNYISGGKYSIINEKFQKFSKKRKTIKPIVKKVLISMGGTDPNNITSQVISSLIGFTKKIKITVVLGPLADEPDISLSEGSIKIIRETKEMEKLMWESDFAILSGGLSLYEASTMGLPSLIIVQKKDQIKTAEEFHKCNCMYYMGVWNKVSSKNVINTFSKLINDYSLRKKMSDNGRILIDGLGLNRVIKLIEISYETWKSK